MLKNIKEEVNREHSDTFMAYKTIDINVDVYVYENRFIQCQNNFWKTEKMKHDVYGESDFWGCFPNPSA